MGLNVNARVNFKASTEAKHPLNPLPQVSKPTHPLNPLPQETKPTHPTNPMNEAGLLSKDEVISKTREAMLNKTARPLSDEESKSISEAAGKMRGIEVPRGDGRPPSRNFGLTAYPMGNKLYAAAWTSGITFSQKFYEIPLH